MNETTKRYLAERAHENFSNARNEIEQIKSGIEDNRKGRVKLTDIQSHKNRLDNRIARESLEGVDVLERINGVPNFQDISILQKIMLMSEAVCRINIQNEYGSTGSGSGCLIAPNIIMTNNHVLPDETTAAQSLAQFRYQLDQNGNPLTPFSFKLRPDLFFITSTFEKTSDPLSGLDFTMVAVEDVSQEGKKLAEIPYIQLNIKVGKILDGENCVIIQHPARDYKKIVLKDIRLLTVKDDVLWYESDTLPGSSGSIVIGLGTGEVVALHHSGVPRKNQFDQWLLKDGSVYQQGDKDEDIDWIGNEGIRISRILDNVLQQNIGEDKSALRDSIFSKDMPAPLDPTKMISNGITNHTPIIETKLTSTKRTQEQLISFEIFLSGNKLMQNDWRENATHLIKGLKSAELLFPHSTEETERRYAYITVATTDHPFELANVIESLPQVDMCTPDLPMETDIKVGHYINYRNGVESYESMSSGIADWGESERDFKIQWSNSLYAGDAIKNKNPKEYRNWSRRAVGIQDTQKGNSEFGDKLKDLEERLLKIKMVQLDTGYTDHSKVNRGFDLSKDEDFIDGIDARDEMKIGVLKYPGHGTRTASIVVGNDFKDKNPNNGNKGILFNKETSFAKVIPFRIAESVVVINKGRNVFQAVQEAINLRADIIFMCMGSYPRPMLYEIAKKAYDKGIIWVCAAGNFVETVVAPAIYPGTIAVGAINPDGQPWKHSSYGEEIDICAPGEDVYVPFMDKKGNEIMVFGSGTSYATPIIASAAAIWKAKNKKFIDELEEPWMVVEAFRIAMKNAANKIPNVGEDLYGSGIIDFSKLMKDNPENINGEKPLEFQSEFTYAYDERELKHWDLGFRESIAFIWKTIVRKMLPGPESMVNTYPLTPRAQSTLSALQNRDQGQNGKYESLVGPVDVHTGEDLVEQYFKSFTGKEN